MRDTGVAAARFSGATCALFWKQKTGFKGLSP